MENQKIQDIPTLKKTLQDAQNFAAIKKAWPVLKPFFKLFGVNVQNIDESFMPLDDLLQIAKDISSIPDRFNDLFIDKGWILYDAMDLEVAKKAVELGEAGNLESAENVLLEYYSPDQIRFLLKMMSSVVSFRPRMQLSLKALNDYEEGRYYSSVLVVLTLLDGMINEIQQQGFFAKNVNLSAWNSIAGHSKGLQKLAALFNQGRQKTRTEEITLPFRNGILHGMDLGYDNKIVAVKTWAALFAARDWALKAERGELVETPQKPEKSWTEIFKQIKENTIMQEKIKAWQPRNIVIGEDIPKNGPPSSYQNNSPEYILASFLAYWQSNNFGYMAKCHSRHLSRMSPKEISVEYKNKILKEWEIIKVDDLAPAITEITIHIKYNYGNQDFSVEKTVRMIYENGNDFGIVRDTPGGNWLFVFGILS